jgi:alpha-tubulin suppressor-like RCC1 family protein
MGAIQSNGTLWTWGYNFYGQLGQNNTIAAQSSPSQVGGGPLWTRVSCGYFFSAAIQSPGTLWTWGRNQFGQLGISNGINLWSSPVQVGAINYWTQVACGNAQTVAAQSNGTLWAWGSNSYGQLGQNDGTNRSSPVQVGTASTWSQVGAGALQLIAIQNNGTLWMCGYNAQGQLGNNSTTNISTLTQVGSLNKWNFATGAWQILAQQIP